MKTTWSELENVERVVVVALVLQSGLLFAANQWTDKRSRFVDVCAVFSMVIAVLPLRRAILRRSKIE